MPDGIISPGAVGYDINCGVRVLSSYLDYETAQPQLDEVVSLRPY
ncbi:MAG: RtcB family protein [Cyanobacteria bacterium J06635_1]